MKIESCKFDDVILKVIRGTDGKSIHGVYVVIESSGLPEGRAIILFTVPGHVCSEYRLPRYMKVSNKARRMIICRNEFHLLKSFARLMFVHPAGCLCCTDGGGPSIEDDIDILSQRLAHYGVDFSKPSAMGIVDTDAVGEIHRGVDSDTVQEINRMHGIQALHHSIFGPYVTTRV